MPLVVSDNIVLSLPPYVPPGTPRILWNNIVSFDNIEADSEALGYPATNLANPRTNEEWRAAAAGDVEITITTNSADNQAAVGFAGHNFGSAGIEGELGYYDDDEEWVNLVGPFMPGTDEPLLLEFTRQPLVQYVIRLSEGSEAARAAVIYAGDILIMERGLDIDPDAVVPRFARKTEVTTGRSDRGDYLGRIVTSRYIDGIEHNYSHLTASFFRDEVDPFINAAQQDVAFFYAMMADDGVTYDVAFAWLTDDPIPQRSAATGRYKVSLRMGGILE